MLKKNNRFIQLFKPIINTIFIEIKKQKKKFIFFIIISILVSLLQSYILPTLIPFQLLSNTQAEYFQNGLSFINLIALFAACLFFSGIICSEFSKKTGFIIFPKINKYKLIIGKYLGNLILISIIILSYYLVLALFGVYYYGWQFNIRLIQSFLIALLYVIALSSFVTFFSSFMSSVNMTIITTVLILFIGFNIADSIVTLVGSGNIEPLYSLSYLGNLISYILEDPFPEPRYIEITIRGFTIGTWLTPTVQIGITMLVIFIIVYLLLASLLFKRRQL